MGQNRAFNLQGATHRVFTRDKVVFETSIAQQMLLCSQGKICHTLPVRDNNGCSVFGTKSTEENMLGMFVGGLVAYRPSNMLVYLRDGSAQTIVRAATLR